MVSTRQRFLEHFDALCAEHAITYEETGTRSGADLGQRVVGAPRPTGIARYFTALHEIGHVVTAWDGCRDQVVEMELAAWRWALANAITEPSRGVRRDIYARLINYAIAEGRKHHAMPVGEKPDRTAIPSPDNGFWQFLAEMESDPARAAYQAVKVAAATG